MKRTLVLGIILLVMIVTIGSAAPLKLTLMVNGPMRFTEWEDFRGYANVWDKIAAEFGKKHGVNVTVLYRDVSKGTLTVDTLMAAGTPPDVWWDASGHIKKYMNADYALPLEKYGDVSIYMDDLLALYTVNGHVYCLPQGNVGGGFAINQDMLDQIGYPFPEQKTWTTDEFLKLAGKLKAAGIPATMIMAKGGMNSWTRVWLDAFGAKMFNAEGTKTTINSPEALKGLNYIKKLVDGGYVKGNPIEVNDDDGVEFFTTNQVFSCLMQNGHTDGWIPIQLKAGKIKKPINVRFVEVPHEPGRAHTPTFCYQSVVIAHRSKDEARNKIVADLAFQMAGKEAQFYGCIVGGNFSTIKGWQPILGVAAAQTYKDVANLMVTAGFTKNPTGPKVTEAWRLWNTMSEQYMRGKTTPEAFLKQYETEANKVLAQ